ncbi:MAG: hypothetical protein JNK74_07425 [Candidatus Hydrogenedentes bacterium]|nr:hypothetical protein [Candidatus Hydrogenedentota bacterium]
MKSRLQIHRQCSGHSSARLSSGLARGCALLALGAAALAAHGADVSWTGPEFGQWHVGDNWSGGTVPAQGDNVVISSANVTVTDVRQIDGSFTLSGGALFTVTGEGASFTATGATNIDNGRLSVGGGALLDLSQATSYAWAECEAGQIIFVSGANSVLDLSGVVSLSVDVPSCEDVAESIFVSTGGLVDFASLETISAPGEQKFFFNLVLGGALSAPNLKSIAGGDDGSLLATSFIIGEDVDLQLPALESLSNTTITIAGGLFTADAVTEANFCLLSPSGDNSLSLDSLEVMSGGGLTVPTTGRLTLPELNLLRDTFVLLAADSALTVPKLAVVEGTTEPTSFAGAGVISLDAPLLTSARNVAFVVTSVAGEASVLDLSALRTYTWDICEGGVPFTAGGSGALLDVSGLQTYSVTNAGCLGLGYVTGATGGSEIDLSGLTTITAPLGQFVSFLAGGTGTVIDLSSLVNFNPATVTFLENDNGRIIRNTGGEGEGEGEGEGKAPGCGVASGDGDFGAWGAGDTLLVLGLLGAIGLGGRRRSAQVNRDR